MGALIALKAVASHNPNVHGLVMFSPGFNGHPSTFKTSYRLRALLTALLKPDAEIPLPYSTDQVTRVESVRNWLSNDPERRFVLPARMYFELLKLTLQLTYSAQKVTCPVLMMSAGVDNIVDTATGHHIFERIESPSKKELLYQDAWHDLMFDPVLDELADDLVLWIDRTSKP